jgi:hypothetical protein
MGGHCLARHRQPHRRKPGLMWSKPAVRWKLVVIRCAQLGLASSTAQQGAVDRWPPGLTRRRMVTAQTNDDSAVMPYIAGAVELASVIAGLQERRRAFHSEAELQPSLAWSIQRLAPSLKRKVTTS